MTKGDGWNNDRLVDKCLPKTTDMVLHIILFHQKEMMDITILDKQDD